MLWSAELPAADCCAAGRESNPRPPAVSEAGLEPAHPSRGTSTSSWRVCHSTTRTGGTVFDGIASRRRPYSYRAGAVPALSEPRTGIEPMACSLRVSRSCRLSYRGAATLPGLEPGTSTSRAWRCCQIELEGIETRRAFMSSRPRLVPRATDPRPLILPVVSRSDRCSVGEAGFEPATRPILSRPAPPSWTHSPVVRREGIEPPTPDLRGRYSAS